MRQITFSDQELQTIRRQRFAHGDFRVQRRMEILLLCSCSTTHNWTQDELASLVGCSRSTVQRTLTKYLTEGLQSCLRIPSNPSTSELDLHRQALQELFRKQPPRSLQHAQSLIEEQTGIRRGLTQVRVFLLSLGLKPRKVAAVPIPPKSTLEDHVANQNAFLHEELEPRLEEARCGRRQVLFVDAAHFVYSSFLGFLWCVARLCIRAASGRQRYNVLAALDAVRHRLIRVSNHSYINAESVCDLLRAVSECALPGVPITLVLDNARYQKCSLVRELAEELEIELLYLPSYSPNLNLIERVWRFVKGKCLRCKHHRNYQEFNEAIQQCLDELSTTHKKAMESLLAQRFQTFENASLITE